MESLMAKWKTTIDSQKERQKSVGRTKKESTENEFLKNQAQQIVDILLPNQSPPSLSQFQQVVEILNRVLAKQKTAESSEKKAEKSKNESDLESKVSDLEREKIYLRRENQELKKKQEELQDRIAQSALSQELVSMLKDSQQKLMEANKFLIDDIKLLKQAQVDKDKLWDLELEDIKKALGKSS